MKDGPAKQRIFQSNSSKLESSAIILNCTVCKVTLNGKALQRAHDLQHILSPTSAGCSKTQNQIQIQIQKYKATDLQHTLPLISAW